MLHCETSRFPAWIFLPSVLDANGRANFIARRAGARGQFTPDPLYYGSDGEDRRLSRISTCTQARTAAQAAEIICAGARATRDTRRAFGNPALSCGGTKSSNPSPSIGESANFQSLLYTEIPTIRCCSQGDRGLDGLLDSRSAAGRSTPRSSWARRVRRPGWRGLCAKRDEHQFSRGAAWPHGRVLRTDGALPYPQR